VDGTLTYYADHNNVTAKGELIVFGETELEQCSYQGQKYCLAMRFPFPDLHLACHDERTRQAWADSFTKAIQMGKLALRSYMYKRADIKDGGNKKRFFILHGNAITIHKDHDHLNTLQSIIHIDGASTMEFDDWKYRITLTDKTGKQTYVSFDQIGNLMP
jgi:hypothetical protein